MPAAKGRTVVQILVALAALAAIALPAGASIPRPGQLHAPNPEALLATARDAPAPKAAATSRDTRFEIFAGSTHARFHLELQAAADASTNARFHLLTPRKTRVRGLRLPEPLLIGIELPPSRTVFRLYGDVPDRFASEGLYITEDPLGYVDGPNLYQYGLNNPVNFSDPLGLREPTGEDRERQRQLEERLAEFEWTYAEQGRASVSLYKAGMEYPRWSTEPEIVLRKVPVEAVDDASYQAIRARLQRDRDSWVAAVARADEGGDIYYSVSGRYATWNRADRIQENWSELKHIGYIAAIDLGTVVFAHRAMENPLEVVEPPLAPPEAQVPRGTTGFVADVEVTSFGKVVGRGTVDVRATVEGIESGALKPRATFENRPLPGKTTPELPVRPPGYYQEFVQPTPGVSGVGSQRIVRGQGGELYYTPDHYQTFIRLN